MNLYLIVPAFIVLTLSSEKAAADTDLQQKNSNRDHLNPLNEHDDSVNEHDKRTIFGPVRGEAWAKHVVVNKAGIKQVIGYSPIDYKFASVVRPLSGYRYPKPQVLFRLKSPGWKPVTSSVKPIVHVDRPNHIDVVHNQPLPHLDHVHQVPVNHVDHIHQVPVNHLHQVQPVDHIHQVPVNHVHQVQPVPVHAHLHQVPLHVDQLHQINVPHQGHVDAVTHVDHLHPLPVQQPFVPSPVLFEVTKPNLGVLPLGATFPAPVLREVPHVHLNPAVLPLPQPVAPPAQFLPPPQPVVPQTPPVLFEYHGTRNYLPVPFLNRLPTTPLHEIPAPNILQSVHQHQHLPLQQQPNFLEQQVPVGAPQQQFQQDLWQQIQAQSQNLNVPQQQLPLETDDDRSNFEQHHVIQPGQTDVQIPFHLPQHHAWNNADVQEGYPESGRNFQGGFRPSVSLEPPYHK